MESTARSALDLGYHVVIVNDAVADLDERHHRHTLEHIVPRLGEQASTADVLTLLEDAFSRPPARSAPDHGGGELP